MFIVNNRTAHVMDTGGGFILENADQSVQVDAHGGITGNGSSVVETKLSSHQEQRLISYLDDKLLDVSRKYRKKFEGGYNHPCELITDLDPLISIIDRIPRSSIELKTQYLLRVAGDLHDQIPSFHAHTSRGELANVSPQDVSRILDFFQRLDGVFLGLKGVAQTDKVRMINVLSHGRERISEWVRKWTDDLGIGEGKVEGGVSEALDARRGQKGITISGLQVRVAQLYDRTLDDLSGHPASR